MTMTLNNMYGLTYTTTAEIEAQEAAKGIKKRNRKMITVTFYDIPSIDPTAPYDYIDNIVTGILGCFREKQGVKTKNQLYINKYTLFTLMANVEELNVKTIAEHTGLAKATVTRYMEVIKLIRLMIKPREIKRGVHLDCSL